MHCTNKIKRVNEMQDTIIFNGSSNFFRGPLKISHLCINLIGIFGVRYFKTEIIVSENGAHKNTPENMAKNATRDKNDSWNVSMTKLLGKKKILLETKPGIKPANQTFCQCIYLVESLVYCFLPLKKAILRTPLHVLV